tara:strand:- start:13 stop:174 length:162 start_codon:yes stop_codon:yes gene_type:complete
MKLAELIIELQALLDESGDVETNVEVVYLDAHYDKPEDRDPTSVNVRVELLKS